MKFIIKILFFLLSTSILAQNTENCDRSLREEKEIMSFIFGL